MGLLGAPPGAGKLRGFSQGVVLGSLLPPPSHQAGIVTTLSTALSAGLESCTWAGSLPVLLVLRV